MQNTLPKRHKIALVGAGNIGGTLAHLALQRQLGDVVLYDVAEGIPQGKALDLMQSCAVDGINASCIGTNDPADLKDADVMIVTAGVPRKPGMSRDDLLSINAKIVRSIADNIKTYCPNAFVIVVTNPLDAMVWLMQQASGLPASHVVGMAGVLDSGRYKHFLAEALNVAVSDIQSFVFGGHGDAMVPMPRFTTINGIPLEHFIESGKITQEQVDAINERTKNGGAEIVNLLKTGSAFYAPASSALLMAESYLRNLRMILPCAVSLNGEYAYQDIYAGVPVIIGRKGAEEIINLPLTASEHEFFNSSVQGVRKLIEDIQKLGI